MKARDNTVLFILTIWMAGGIYLLGFKLARTDFISILCSYAGLFGFMLFCFSYFKKNAQDWRRFFLIGIFLRLLLLPAIPLWSEDFARFLWDGELLNRGFNPYSQTPNQWIRFHWEEFSAYLQVLHHRMNSPDYYSVYPPFNQFFFWLGAKLGGGSLIPNLMVLRGILIAGEIAVFFILKSLLFSWGDDFRKLIFYWLNPFTILEGVGNLHFEGLVLLFLLGTLLSLEKKYTLLSGSLWGLAVGLKLVPLILAPGFLRLSKQFRFFLVSAIILILLFLPLIKNQSWSNLSQSLALYQGKFEFNASIYYLAREVGYWVKGYNTIAYLTKGLSALTLVLIGFLAFKKKLTQTQDWIELWIGIYWIYLLLQPVVHPWYLIPGLGLTVLTQKIGFLVWSLVVVLSYQAYGNYGNLEYPTILWLEYLLVCLALIYDYRRHYFTLPYQLLKR